MKINGIVMSLPTWNVIWLLAKQGCQLSSFRGNGGPRTSNSLLTEPPMLRNLGHNRHFPFYRQSLDLQCLTTQSGKG